MKIIDFNYTKDNGLKSTRTVIVLDEPNTMVKGIDISELMDEVGESGLQNMIHDYFAIETHHKKQLSDFLYSYDLTHKYRQFKPEKMTNITTKDI